MRTFLSVALLLSLVPALAAQPIDLSDEMVGDECVRFDRFELSDIATEVLTNIEANTIALNTSTVDPDKLLSTCNRFVTLAVDGPNIFAAARDIIAQADHEVDLAFFVWENEASASRLIGDGLIAAQARRTPDDPLLVRMIRDDVEGITGPGRVINELYDSQKDWESRGLDPARVKIQLGTAARSQQWSANLHDKMIVVDGRYVLVTGANVQPHNDPPESWHDSGYVLEGDVALSALSAFEQTWNSPRTDHWECKDRSRRADCQQRRRHFGPPDHNWLPPFGSQRPGDIPVLAVTRTAARSLTENTDNPQDIAWLRAMEQAQSYIYVETPNINDNAFLQSVVDAVRRGVEVRLITGLGFNGTITSVLGSSNLPVVGELRKTIRRIGRDASERFNVRWYSNNGDEPITDNGPGASHTKYMSVDGRVAIVGSGNQDVFSWNYSQEFNLLIDDPSITSSLEGNLFLQDWDSSVGNYVELYEENQGEGKLLCPIATNIDKIVEFGDFHVLPPNDTWRCDNDAAQSLLLHNVASGKVFRFYDDPDRRFEDDDWMEILVKRDVARKYIDTLEHSFEDEDVRVTYHRDNGLDGKVSSAVVSTATFGPVIDLYDKNDDSGGLVCSLRAGGPQSLNFKNHPHCDNDAARSLVLSNFTDDKVLFLYDHPGGSTSDDWVVIVPRRTITRTVVGSFESSFKNEDVEVCAFPDNGLDGKVSRLRIGDRSEAVGICGEPPAPEVSYTVSPEPSSIYPDSGGELTDGVTQTGTDWVNALGWLFVDPTITFDLGAIQPVESVQLYVGNSFNDGSFGVARPANVEIHVSTDGVAWTNVGRLAFAVFSGANTKEQVDLGIATVNTTARWVRYVITRGGPWTMATEISVNENPLICDGIGDGIWDGCRGTGCSVCAEKLVGFDCYFENHPACILNTTCEGRFFSCDKACPPPTEADRCSSGEICDGIGDGIWDGCRGTGCSVCAEKLVGFDCYFENHPECILNTTCEGRFFSCDQACPPPTEADRCGP